MRSEDKGRFAAALAGLAEVFNTHGKEMSAVAVELYFRTLKDLAIEEVEAACIELVGGRVFNGMPKPAEIREAARGTREDAALLAWQKLDRAVRRIGPYESVQFDDPVIHSAVEMMGGWTEIQNCSAEDWRVWRRKDFERAYQTLAKRWDHPEHLPGLIELDNGPKGFEVPKPVRIGFEERKRLEEGSEDGEQPRLAQGAGAGL